MIARVPQPARTLLLSSRLGLVSIPAPATLDSGDPAVAGDRFSRSEARTLLRELGRALGLNVLETRPEAFPATSEDAQEDGAQAASADAFAEDEAVRKAMEGLDAVWLDGAGPAAVFVLETGRGGWEGLRRLADLLALHPKLKAPLYAVTVPELRAGIEAEVHRPAYRLHKKPLAEALRLLDWSRLKSEVEQLGERVRYLKPEFLEGMADRVAAPASE